MAPEAFYQEIQPELTSGERILWTGQPSTKVVFGPQDFLMIPFSLLWGGFAIFWEAAVVGVFAFQHEHSSPGSWFMALWGIPFVLVGQYMIWGRFFYTAWKKKRVVYAVTDKRVLVVSLAAPFTGRQATSAYLGQLPAIEKSVRRNGIGTLRFGLSPVSTSASRLMGMWDGGLSSPVPLFADVEDAENVYRIVSDAREKAMRRE